MVSAPTINRQPQGQTTKPAQVMPIPFTRAAHRKSIQAGSGTVTLSAGALTPVAPIVLPPAGFIRDIELYIQVTSTGNGATVAVAAVNDQPWNYINSMQVTNAAGDTIYVPINGYQLYLINKYGGMYQAPNCDPRRDPAFVALTTGAGATAGTGSFMLRIPFELDPRDAFCALPNLAANKAYQVLINFASIAAAYAGGTAPSGAVTITWTMVMNYWSQPQPANGDGYPQQTAPGGVGSVSLWQFQSQVVTGGNKITQLINVGNTIRMGIFTLYSSAGTPIRDDTDWPATSYIRLNNDQLFYKPSTFWLSQMRQAYEYGQAAGTKDTADNLDTGVYVLPDFMSQHGSVDVDGPRDQYLVTLDSTLIQHEAANFGGSAGTLYFLTNSIKPISAAALYSLNIV